MDPRLLHAYRRIYLIDNIRVHILETGQDLVLSRSQCTNRSYGSNSFHINITLYTASSLSRPVSDNWLPCYLCCFFRSLGPSTHGRYEGMHIHTRTHHKCAAYTHAHHRHHTRANTHTWQTVSCRNKQEQKNGLCTSVRQHTNHVLLVIRCIQ